MTSRFDVDMQVLKKGGKVYSTGPLMRTLFRTFHKRRQKMENSSVIKSSNNKTTSPTMMNSPSQDQVIAMFSAYMVVCGRRGFARKVSFLVTNKAFADVMILRAMSLVFL